ncbi:hypothetical protein ID866_11227 [Astraeus odoratus]|nr:hypothetical protein ID866_11227 [Astraeus odoratus]
MSLIHLLTIFPLLLCVSLVEAFNITVGTATECDPLTISWTGKHIYLVLPRTRALPGGESPFEIITFPVRLSLPYEHTRFLPATEPDGSQGSYSITQLPLAQGTQFVVTMSDLAGFGTGGTSGLIAVGAPTGSNPSCNTTTPSANYTFSTPSLLQQCQPYDFNDYTGAVLPVTLVGLVPGGQAFVIGTGVNSTNYSWVANVSTGTEVIFSIFDAKNISGGVSPVQIVVDSSDPSCLNIDPSPSDPVVSINTSTSTPSFTFSTTSSSPAMAPSTSSNVPPQSTSMSTSVITTTVTTPTSSSTSSAETSSGTSTKPYNAIVIGLASAVAAVSTLLCCAGLHLVRRKRKNRSRTAAMSWVLPDLQHKPDALIIDPTVYPFPYNVEPRSLPPSDEVTHRSPTVPPSITPATTPPWRDSRSGTNMRGLTNNSEAWGSATAGRRKRRMGVGALSQPYVIPMDARPALPVAREGAELPPQYSER